MATVTVVKGKGSFDVIQKIETDVVTTPAPVDAYPSEPQFIWAQTYKFKEKWVWIYNTHATNTIRYRVEIQPGDSELNTRIVALKDHDGSSTDYDIAPGEYKEVYVPQTCEVIRVKIKNSSAGQTGSFAVQGTAHLAFVRG